MNDIKKFLIKVGFNPTNMGTEYAVACIQKIVQDKSVGIIAIYDDVGKDACCSRSAVDRSIRIEIDRAKDRNPDFYEMLGLPEFWKNESLTNKLFLHTAAQKIVEEDPS